MDNEDGTLPCWAPRSTMPGPPRCPPPPAPRPRPAPSPATSWPRWPALLLQRPARRAQGRRRKGDRNVELVVRDPFAGKGAGLCAGVTAKTTGGGVNGALLGRTRATVRRTVTKYALKAKSSRVDRYCLVGGGFLRGGSLGDRSAIALSSNRSQRRATSRWARPSRRCAAPARRKLLPCGLVHLVRRDRVTGPGRGPDPPRQGRADGPGRQEADVDAEPDRRALLRGFCGRGAPRPKASAISS